MKDRNEIVAVKCEGPFTEWYSPFYKEPFNDNAEYRKYYEEHIMDIQPVIGPSLNTDDDEECISDDLDCLTDRLCVDVGLGTWDDAKGKLADAINDALNDGKVRIFSYDGMEDVKITPYRRGDMPKPNENHLKVYGPFADLIRERVAAI